MSIATSAGLELVARYGAPERWLAVLVTLRPDGEPSTSVVTAGALPHPVTGEQVVAHTINEPAAAGAYQPSRPRARSGSRRGRGAPNASAISGSHSRIGTGSSSSTFSTPYTSWSRAATTALARSVPPAIPSSC